MREHVTTFFQIMKWNWRASKRLVLWSLFNALAQGLRLLLNVWLPKLIIDGVLTGELSSVAWYVLGMIVSNVVLAKIPGFTNSAIKFGLNELIDGYQYFIAETIFGLDFAQLEDPEVIKLKDSASFMALHICVQLRVLDSSVKLFSSFVMVISVMTLVLRLSPLLVLLIVLAAGLQFFVAKRTMARVSAMFKENEQRNVAYNAYVKPSYDEAQNMHVRLYSMEDTVIRKVATINEQLKKTYGENHREMGRGMGIINAVNVLAVALAYLYVGIRTLSDRLGPRLSLGSFAFYIAAFTQLNSQLTGLAESTSELISSLYLTRSICEFLSLPTHEEQSNGRSMPSHIETLEFRDVWFRYPVSEAYVLKGVSFAVRRGEKISLVGLNGSGKTTVVKLLCRFYEPEKGSILINGIDITEFDEADYRAKMSVIFQDYRLLSLSIGENVACSEQYDEAKVRRELERVGLSERLRNLPDGLGTVMSGSTGGDLRLSGGESQKVAIARALYRDSDLIVLDEPTSALDPKAEADIYENFSTLVADKMAIYISHRMSSSIFCDRILVLDDGRIIEDGTHAELMRRGGLYHELFSAQKRYYLLEHALDEPL